MSDLLLGIARTTNFHSYFRLLPPCHFAHLILKPLLIGESRCPGDLCGEALPGLYRVLLMEVGQLPHETRK